MNPNERSGMTVMLGALFRAAQIASGSETNEFQNNAALQRAEEFINACVARGLIVFKEE